ncbi:CCAAT/enhancer-binding protein beta [Echinococcus granulosus]|uniref:CCAAT/enhancer-binding protein beta n=1 Tax=Echinococcus granulosus TaxID=6210 RepID=W6U345_ECHGR|nr:CCAAT/enhancer-binding protein beta [Echinococcus granulosus]EUB55513.1 CCAAT/enhancer-binding protein beta [Echinococcus granulosus]
MSSDDYARHQQQHQKSLADGAIKMEPTIGRSVSFGAAAAAATATAGGGGGDGGSAKAMRGKPTSALHMEEEKYIALRKRNNIAVRKSREKQRAKQNEVIKTLSILRDENSSLQSTVAARIRELNLLNSLLKQVKHAPPKRLSKILSAYNLEQGPDLCSDNPILQSSTSSSFSPSSSPHSIPSSSSAAIRLISTTAYRQQQ